MEESTESQKLRARVKERALSALYREKPMALARLSKLMESEAAMIDGRLDEAREKLIKWVEGNVEQTHHLTWIEMEEIVEEAAER